MGGSDPSVDQCYVDRAGVGGPVQDGEQRASSCCPRRGWPRPLARTPYQTDTTPGAVASSAWSICIGLLPTLSVVGRDITLRHYPRRSDAYVSRHFALNTHRHQRLNWENRSGAARRTLATITVGD